MGSPQKELGAKGAYKEDEYKLDFAGGGTDPVKGDLSEKDVKLLEAFYRLHVDPDIKIVEDLDRFMRKYGGITKSKSEKSGQVDSGVQGNGNLDQQMIGGQGAYQFPKISIFLW